MIVFLIIFPDAHRVEVHVLNQLAQEVHQLTVAYEYYHFLLLVNVQESQ